jgi:hypothetical protein
MVEWWNWMTPERKMPETELCQKHVPVEKKATLLEAQLWLGAFWMLSG